MLSLSALSNSLILSAVSRMASWEAERGSWGARGVQRRRTRRRVGSKVAKAGERVFFFEYTFVLKTHHQMFLHWNNTVLAKDNLRKDVFVSPFAKRNPIHVKQKQRIDLRKSKAVMREEQDFS